MTRRALRVCVIGFGLGMLALPAAPEMLPIGEDLDALGWRHHEFSGMPANQFFGRDDGSIEILSADSISALYQPVSVDLAETPCLGWSWRVDEAMPANDLRHRDTDDRPVALYVVFPYDSARASFWERLMRVFVELAAGSDAPGQVIAYTWGGIGQRGDIQPSPYLRSAGSIVLLRPGNAPTGVWHDELVDVAADYKRIFEVAADHPIHVALLADSDSTDSRARASVRDIQFSDQCSIDNGQ